MSMCACMGPQNGEPLCPCQMRAAREYLGNHPQPVQPILTRGCVCPPGAELTCRGFGCPRQGFVGSITTSGWAENGVG